jgi:hypothetical protein
MSRNLCIQTRVICLATTRSHLYLIKGPGSGHMPTLHHSLDIDTVVFPLFCQYRPGVERLAGHGYGVFAGSFVYIYFLGKGCQLAFVYEKLGRMCNKN